MPDGISIGIGSDTRAFASGVQKGLIEPLEDVQDTLKDVAKAGDAATADLEGQFRDQQRATVDYGRQYKQMSDDIKRSSQSTSRSMQQDSRQFQREASEGFDEVKDSARSNAIEIGASFTGGMDQAIGGVQGFLAEFLAGFGPGGIIAGVGIASLLGIVSQKMEEGTESAEAQKQAVADLASQYIATGKAGRRSFDDIASAIETMATSKPEDVIITLQQAWEDAKVSGAEYQSTVAAIASASPEQIGKARKALEEVNLQQQLAARGFPQVGSAGYDAAMKAAQGAGKLNEALRKAEEQAREAGHAQEVAAAAGLSKLQLKQDLLGQLESAYDDAATGADHFNKKTGEFEAAGYIKEFKKLRRELVDYKNDIAKTDLSPEAVKFLESQGAESAAAMLRGYKKSSPAQKADLEEIWSTAGTENATSYEEALGKKLDGITAKSPKIETPIVPPVDTSALDRFVSTPYVKRLVLEGVTRNGTRVF